MDELSLAQLFDAALLDDTVLRLQDDLENQKLEEKAHSNSQLRRNLIPELQRHIEKLDQYVEERHRSDFRGHQAHVEAARKFLKFTETLCARIESGEMLETDPKEFELHWVYFIAYAQMEYHRIWQRLEFSKEQSERGKKGALGRWGSEEKEVVDEIVSRLSRKKKYQDLVASELWDEFFGELDAAGLSPKETENGKRITFTGGSMNLRTFQNRLNPKKNK